MHGRTLNKKERNAIGERLRGLHRKYHRRELVHPDPLVFLYDYTDPRDREIAGLVASSLAYGRVAQIMKGVSSVLVGMGKSPSLFLMSSSRDDIVSMFSGFRHRFTTGREISGLLWAGRKAMENFGSLQECFRSGLRDQDETVLPALSAFVGFLRRSMEGCRKGFLPSPDEGSACKRWNLFLRWMVREDDVDPGGWPKVPCSKLVIPLDTHMHRIALTLGLTRRKQADQRTSLEITRAFRKITPEDPIRYDFVLTRFGIRKDMDMSELGF
jgi:uncharacterized protein (TIGR02757 family)